MALPLTEEVEYFNLQKSKLVKKFLNQWVLIKGERIVGNFQTEEEAYRAGVEQFGNEPFLIKLVSEHPESPAQVPALWVGKITNVDS